MEITNRLRSLVLDAAAAKSLLAAREAQLQDAQRRNGEAVNELRGLYFRLLDEARQSGGNPYPPHRVVTIDGRAFLLKLNGSADDDCVVEVQVEGGA